MVVAAVAVLMLVVMIMVVLVVMVVVLAELSVVVEDLGPVLVVVPAAADALALLLIIIVIIVVVVLVAVAFLPILVVVMVVLMIMVVAVAFLPILVVMVVVLVLLALLMVMVVVMVVLQGLLVDVVVETGVVDGVDHPVGEFVLVDVEHGAHEVELDGVLPGQGPVVLHSVVHVDEVEGESLSVVDEDGGLDVAEQASGLALNEPSDGHEGVRHPGLGVGIPVVDGSGEAGGDSSGLLEGGLLVLAHSIIP